MSYLEAARSPLRFRQVHLDFHTSEHIHNVGAGFDPGEFADTLAGAHVNSVTCFSRCHHGWSYHDTKVGARHPGLVRDLLPEMIEACHSRGISVPVYVTVGWDERSAREHPEWMERRRDGSPNGAGPFEAGWRKLCLNTPYLDFLLAYTEETVRAFDLDGLFMDIVWQEHCRCPRCLEGMLARGLDPENEDDCETFVRSVLERYYERVDGLVEGIKPGLRIFHNKGNVDRGRRDLTRFFTHWEIESLPTGGWGYDHFSVGARYAAALEPPVESPAKGERRSGFEFLGMTGKFHTSWGELGGYKAPEALAYECDLMLALGSRCSVGDQLHPSGQIDRDTYRIIGEAYADVEAKEPWCEGAEPVSDVALFSLESEHSLAFSYMNPHARPDEGAARMLLEHGVMFDVIDRASDFSRYRLLILPDEVTVDDLLRAKLAEYVKGGGALLSSGRSGLDPSSGKFAVDFGADWGGESEWERDYLVAGALGGGGIPKNPMVMYARAVRLVPCGGEVLATARAPYFNRSWNHFCSHRNTPPVPDGSSDMPAAIRKGKVIHFSHRVFSAYREMGQVYLRRTVMNALDLLLPDRRVRAALPSGGRVSLMRQPRENRHILHLLYAVPMHRGEAVDVIEDIVPIFDVACSVALDRKPGEVYLAPGREPLSFEWREGRVHFNVPEVRRHAMVVME
jgi:hypothetical protein